MTWVFLHSLHPLSIKSTTMPMRRTQVNGIPQHRPRLHDRIPPQRPCMCRLRWTGEGDFLFCTWKATPHRANKPWMALQIKCSSCFLFKEMGSWSLNLHHTAKRCDSLAVQSCFTFLFFVFANSAFLISNAYTWTTTLTAGKCFIQPATISVF